VVRWRGARPARRQPGQSQFAPHWLAAPPAAATQTSTQRRTKRRPPRASGRCGDGPITARLATMSASRPASWYHVPAEAPPLASCPPDAGRCCLREAA
jgi:hypothetical protein